MPDKQLAEAPTFTGLEARVTALEGAGPGGGIADGDKGDVVVSESGAAWTIKSGAVGLSKMAELAAGTILGRAAGAAGAPVALSAAQATSLLNPFTRTLKGLVPPPGGTDGTTKFLCEDMEWREPAGGGGGGAVADGSITLAKMANLAQGRLIGRLTAGAGVPEALTGEQAFGLLQHTGVSTGGAIMTLPAIIRAVKDIVVDFGADPTGATSSVAAWNRAVAWINANGPVSTYAGFGVGIRIPGGLYDLKAGGVDPITRMNVEFFGHSDAVLLVKDGTVFELGTAAVIQVGFRLKGVTLRTAIADTPNAASGVIKIVSASEVIADRVRCLRIACLVRANVAAGKIVANIKLNFVTGTGIVDRYFVDIINDQGGAGAGLMLRYCELYAAATDGAGPPANPAVLPVAITSITAANPPVVTTTSAHGFATGARVAIRDVQTMTQVNEPATSNGQASTVTGNDFLITVLSATTFSLQTLGGANVNGSGWAAGTGGFVAQRHFAFAHDKACVRVKGQFDTWDMQGCLIQHWANMWEVECTTSPGTGSRGTVTGITKANPGVVTVVGHGFSTGDRIKLNDVGGMTEVNGVDYLVGTTTADTFQLKTYPANANVNTTGFGTFTSGGEVRWVTAQAVSFLNIIDCYADYIGRSMGLIKLDGGVLADFRIKASWVWSLDDDAIRYTYSSLGGSIIGMKWIDFIVGSCGGEVFNDLQGICEDATVNSMQIRASRRMRGGIPFALFFGSGAGRPSVRGTKFLDPAQFYGGNARDTMLCYAGIVIPTNANGAEVTNNHVDVKAGGEHYLINTANNGNWLVTGNSCATGAAPEHGRGRKAITVGASPFVWTNNTGAPVRVQVTGGTVSALEIGDTAAAPSYVSAASTTVPVNVARGEKVRVTYSVTPTMTYAMLDY